MDFASMDFTGRFRVVCLFVFFFVFFYILDTVIHLLIMILVGKLW